MYEQYITRLGFFYKLRFEVLSGLQILIFQCQLKA